jgi:hypothetical protein
LSRLKRQRDLADAQVIVDGFEAALGLDRKIEISIPIVLGCDGPGARMASEKSPGSVTNSRSPSTVISGAKLPTDVVPWWSRLLASSVTPNDSACSGGSGCGCSRQAA